MKVTVVNRGNEPAEIHALILWFRNFEAQQ
jgi:hypothetical protein